MALHLAWPSRERAQNRAHENTQEKKKKKNRNKKLSVCIPVYVLFIPQFENNILIT